LEPNFTEEEFEILFNKLFRNNGAFAGLFGEFTDREDLKAKITNYRSVVESASSNQGAYRGVDNARELQDIQRICDILFGDIHNLPLQINRGFKEAAKYRLEIGK
jgi:hypothetical protein